MLTKEKLERVGETREALKDLGASIGRLIEDEPKQQPPTERSVTLEKMAGQLDEMDAELDRLWS
jgi:hypothetical protein